MDSFKIGDRVRIREWDDMAREFGLVDESIPVRCGFIKRMKPLCGAEAIIKEIRENGGIRLSDWSVKKVDTSFSYSLDMIELVHNEMPAVLEISFFDLMEGVNE